MIDYTTTVERDLALGLWNITLRDGTTLRVTGEQLDELAQALAFRLEGLGVVPGPTGVELRVGASATVHLCYSDDAEDFARAVVECAGRNGVTV